MRTDTSQTSSAPDYGPEFDAVFEQSRTAMVVAADDRRLCRANPAATRLTGYTRDELMALRIDDLYEPGQRDLVDDRWAEALHAGSLLGNRALYLNGGGIVPVHFTATTVGPDAHLVVYTPTPPTPQTTELHVHADLVPTPRQRQIITQLALGATTQEIAEHLHLAHETVRTHVRNAMRATRARNRTHLVALALQNGWIVGPD